MKKRYTEEQIIGFLREADAGVPIVELCRRHGFSEASFYLWRNKFGGMSVSDAKRLKELEGENARLKRLLANAMLENEVIKEALQKSGSRTSTARVGAVSGRQRHKRTTIPADCTDQCQRISRSEAARSQCRTAGRDRSLGTPTQALRSQHDRLEAPAIGLARQSQTGRAALCAVGLAGEAAQAQEGTGL